MTRWLKVPAATVLLLLSLTLAGTAWGQDYCALCHLQRPEQILSEPVTLQGNSAHGAAEMSCADCHGGRREVQTVLAHDRKAGFDARPAPETIPEICGGCHADAARLGNAAKRLPLDQLDNYQRSGHGRALARGNGEAATCASCHGTHSVANAEALDSLMHPENIAPTCGGCHSDSETMTNSGMPLNQTTRWRRSVHGRAFVEEENMDAPTCNMCHDAHGGITGLDDVAACGRCHENQERSFSESPHAEVFERLGFASCVDCHGSHDVREVQANFIGAMRDSSCRLCHNEQQPIVFETIRRFGELRAAAEMASRRGYEALEQLNSTLRHNPEARDIADELERASEEMDYGIHAFDESTVEHAVRLMTEAATKAVILERKSASEQLGGTNTLMVALIALILLASLGAGLLFRRRI